MEKQKFNIPRILECSHYANTYVPQAGDTQTWRYVKDYEMDYNLTDGRIMWVDDQKYILKTGSMICRRPGQRTSSMGYFNMYKLTLDFSHHTEPGVNMRHHIHEMQPEDTSYFWDILPTVFEPIHGKEIVELYMKIACLSVQSNRIMEVGYLIAELLHLLVADAYAEKSSFSTEYSSIDMAIVYLNEHYMQDVSLDEIAQHVKLNKSYLVRLFHRETGLTPMNYLNEIRLNHARKLLINSNCPVVEAAWQCGFKNASWFISCFKRQYGDTPDIYRKKHMNKIP